MKKDYSEIKNKAIICFLGVLIIVILYTVFFGVFKKYERSLYFSRTFNVTAEEKATVSPDIAKLSFSVVSEGRNPKTLAEDNNRKISAAIDMLKSKDVEDKDIKTTQYNLSPRYEYNEDTKKTFISGYTLTQTVSVKVRVLDRVAEVLGALPDLGINQIGSVSFEVDEPDQYLKEARANAFAKAKEKAMEIAKANKFSLGKIMNIYENYGGGARPYYDTSAIGMGGAESFKASLPTISPGSEEITVQVNVTYQIK